MAMINLDFTPRIGIPSITNGVGYTEFQPTSSYNGGIGGMKSVTGGNQYSPGNFLYGTGGNGYVNGIAMGSNSTTPTAPKSIWAGLNSEQKVGTILGGIGTIGQLGLGLFQLLEGRKQAKDAARRWNMEWEANKRVTNGKIRGKEEARRAAMSDRGASRGNIDDYVKARGI